MDEMKSKVSILKRVTQPLEGVEGLDGLIDRLSDSRLVLLGEASHGTHEYYTWRAALSRRLILDHGFDFIAVGRGLARFLSRQPFCQTSGRRSCKPGQSAEGIQSLAHLDVGQLGNGILGGMVARAQ